MSDIHPSYKDTGLLVQNDAQKCLEALKNAPIGIFTSSPQGGFLSVNPALSDMLGYESPEKLIDSITHICSQIYADPEEEKALERLLNDYGQAANYQCRWIRRDGSLIRVSNSVQAVRDENGHIIHYQGFVVATGDCEKAGEDLSRKDHHLISTKRRLKSITDAMGEGLYVMDEQGLITFANPAAASLLGYEQKDLLGKVGHDLFHCHQDANGRRTSKLECPFFQTVMSGKAYRAKEKFQRRDGSIFPVEVTARPMTNENAIVVGAVTVFSDISVREEAERKLRENEQLLSDMIGSIQAGISVLDTELNIVYANSFMERWYEKNHPLRGKKCYQAYHDREEPCPECPSLRCMRTKKLESMTVPGLPGSNQWLEVFSHPMKDPETQEVNGVVEFVQDITESKRLEQELREQNNLLESIINGIPDILAIQYPDHSIERYNQAGYRILNMTPEEVRGKKCFELIGRDRECEECATRIALRTKELAQLEKYVPELDVYLDCRSVPILDRQGKVVKIVEQLRDITSRKLAEEALKKSEERYRSLVESQQDAIARIDRDNLFTYVNDVSCRIFGKKREELLGHPFMPFVYEEDLEKLLEELEKIHQPPHRVQIIHRLTSPSGFYWMHWECGAIFDASGQIVEIQSVGRDITEMMFQQQKLELILEAAQNVSFVLTEPAPDQQDHLIRDFSPGAENILGYEREEVLGRSVFMLHSEANLEKFPAIQAAVARNQPWHGRAWLVRKSGEKFPALFTVYPFDLYGRMGMLGVSIDISELEKVQQELVQAKEQAEAANYAKSEFLANMSHEIRTPINGILGIMQLLQDTDLDPEQQDHVNMGIVSANRLTRLLSDILDLSRIEAGQMEIRKEEVDIKKLCDSVDELFMLTSREKNISLGFSLDPELPSVILGDEARLQQILFNLVGNALKFTEKGWVNVNWNLHHRDDNSKQVLISVSDTGIGMSDDSVEELFKPFAQAEDAYTRKYQGAGLGLSIVSRLVQMMQGNMSVESTPGEGSTFYVSLPLELPEQSENDPEKLEQEADKSKSGLQILLVEDDPSNQVPMKMLLEKAGHKVSLAEDGQKALDILSDQDFDCILMDIHMPVMDGVEATRRIREAERRSDLSDGLRPGEAYAPEGAMERSESLDSRVPESRPGLHTPEGTPVQPGKIPRIPIIALTAYAMNGDREKFLEAGMDDYLAKPVQKEDLERVIKKHCG